MPKYRNEQFYIGTTRFNDETFKENVDWRMKHRHDGCIYPVNKSIAESITKNVLIYVIEMNNTQNKIMGIGLIRNEYDKKQKIRVYNSDLNYNRYVYHSKHRKDISDIEDKKVIEILEIILFKGYRHMKRGQGITCLPMERFKTKKCKKLMKTFFENLFE